VTLISQKVRALRMTLYEWRVVFCIFAAVVVAGIIAGLTFSYLICRSPMADE
jgi:hypothetical protein